MEILNSSEKLPQKDGWVTLWEKSVQCRKHGDPDRPLKLPRGPKQMHAAIPTHLTLSQPIRTSSSPITYHYCTILHSHSEPLVHTLPAWQSPRSKSKIIQHPTTACGFGSCHASAQPRVGAWRRPGHRLRRGQGGPRSPPEAAPWNQRFHAFAGAWRKKLTFDICCIIILWYCSPLWWRWLSARLG